MSTVLTNVLRANRDSIQWLLHRTGPVLPLLHWMEYQYFLYSTSNFEYVNCKLKLFSAKVRLSTSFASFNTSRSRFPTETQLKLNWKGQLWNSRCEHQCRCGQYKATFAHFKYIKRHVSLKELESWLERGKNIPFLREICPPKNVPPILAPISAP
jgi:hypothetical protein